jgi:hypothetical protein
MEVLVTTDRMFYDVQPHEVVYIQAVRNFIKIS